MPQGPEAGNHIIAETEGGVMTICLNRPRTLNSLTLSMIRQTRATLEYARSSDKIRMVLLKGSGEKAFCAGSDIKAISTAVKENRSSVGIDHQQRRGPAKSTTGLSGFSEQSG